MKLMSPSPNQIARTTSSTRAPLDSPVPSQKSTSSLVANAACTTGGIAGGMVLGGLAGEFLSSATGNQSFRAFGSAVGSVAGASLGYAKSVGVDGAALGRVGSSWVLGTAGMAAGQYLLGGVGILLAVNGASTQIAQAAPAIGALSGLALGASMPYIGRHSGTEMVVQQAGLAGLGAGVGWLSGGLCQQLAQGSNCAIGSATPILGAAAGMLVGAALRPYVADSEPNKELEKNSPGYAAYRRTVEDGAAVVGMAYLGHVLADCAGNMAAQSGAGPLYQVAAPILGPMIGAAAGAALATDGKSGPVRRVAVTSAATLAIGSAGAILGDAVGHGLTAFSGNPIYASLGGAVGALDGVLTGIVMPDGAKHSPVEGACLAAWGASFGVAAGATAGAVMDSFTGSHLYGAILPALGGLAGGLAGFAGTQPKSQPKG